MIQEKKSKSTKWLGRERMEDKKGMCEQSEQRRQGTNAVFFHSGKVTDGMKLNNQEAATQR